ncbi:uncharacterized protein LOC110859113 [Folsomia candida]|uniref:uncharacterized protein LOC110859113 n=2 Tax=Folsomia candida TaxID=158441 RepID=UPI000B8FDFEF|nr:uncharacterized protein LOC110859113 [Folsomia candida]XP_035715152.1 uncharacterized protein LOC110859113 [Folsomia candida]
MSGAKVEFLFRCVNHKAFGPKSVSSYFTRIDCPLEQDPICPATLSRLVDALLLWCRDYFPDVQQNPHYYKETALASIYYICYGNPLCSVTSPEMDIAIKFAMWLWLFDDAMEDLTRKNIDPSVFKEETDRIGKITQGCFDPQRAAPPPQCPAQTTPPPPSKDDVQTLFWNFGNSLYAWHQLAGRAIMEYSRKMRRFNVCMATYMQALQWMNICHIDGRYSETTFKAFRKPNSYFCGIAELLAVLNNVDLGGNGVEDGMIFNRVVDSLTSIGAFTNDVLGLKKDFKPEAHDNLVVFKVIEKNKKLETAVNQVCHLISEEVADYGQLKRVLLHQTGENEGVEKYLQVWEALLHGHLRLYAECTRYRCCGEVTIN